MERERCAAGCIHCQVSTQGLALRQAGSVQINSHIETQPTAQRQRVGRQIQAVESMPFTVFQSQDLKKIYLKDLNIWQEEVVLVSVTSCQTIVFAFLV